MVECLIFTDMGDYTAPHRTAGAYRLATSLRDAGFTVQVVDYFMMWTIEEVTAALRRYIGPETLFLAFSSTFFTKSPAKGTIPRVAQDRLKNIFTIAFPHDPEFMRTMVNEARALNPKLKVIMGGAKAYHQGTKLVDYFCTGFGDDLIVTLARHLRDPDRYPLKTRPSRIDENIRVVDWHDYPPNDARNLIIRWHESDHLVHGESLPIEVSRGCMFNCTFCGHALKNRKTEYIKDPAILRDELIENHTRWGTTRYVFVDDTHNDSVPKLEALKDVYDGLSFKIEFSSYIRLDLLNAHPQTVDLLFESGLRSTYFGIETLNHASGKAVGKGMHPDRTKEFLAYLKAKWGQQVSLTGSFIFGLPHDTAQTCQDIVDYGLSKDCPLDCMYIYSLYIEKNPAVAFEWQSQFAMNTSKYGYKFDEQGWRSPTMSETQAVELAAAAQPLIFDRNKFSNFAYPALKNIGYDHETIMTKTMPELYADGMINRKNVMIDQYKKAILGTGL